jgi:phage tail sheath protein FI
VRCDNSTTTPDEIEQGIVQITVGFAPLEPAEFIVLQISQRAAQPGK